MISKQKGARSSVHSQKGEIPVQTQPFGNWPVDFKYITKIKLEANYPENPTVWVIYFFSSSNLPRNKREQLVAIWFYKTETDQLSSAMKILADHPHIELK